MQFRKLIRSFFERVPFAFHVIRDVRDTLRLDSLSPLQTEHGFWFVGSGAMQDREYARGESVLMTRLLERHSVLLDIGANVGYFTCLARNLEKTVLCFEPVRTNLFFLYKNLELNSWQDGVEVYPVALGARAGSVSVYGARCGSSLVAGWGGGSPSHEKVSVLPLDSILQDRFSGERVLCKVDVEGFEYQLLQGARGALARAQAPTWLVEIFLKRGRGAALNPHFVETFTMFFDAGYECFGEGDRTVPVSIDRVLQWKNKGAAPAYTNYLFTKHASELV
jgi:FkbM family methyltransferase